MDKCKVCGDTNCDRPKDDLDEIEQALTDIHAQQRALTRQRLFLEEHRTYIFTLGRRGW